MLEGPIGGFRRQPKKGSRITRLERVFEVAVDQLHGPKDRVHGRHFYSIREIGEHAALCSGKRPAMSRNAGSATTVSPILPRR